MASGSRIKRLSAQQRGIAIVGILLSISILTHLDSQVKATSSWIQSSWSGGVGTGTTAQFSSSSNIDYSTGALKLNTLEKFNNNTFEANTANWSTDNTEVTAAVVQTVNQVTITGTSFSVALNQVPQQNNTLIAVLATRSAPGTVTMAGWTQDATVSNSITGSSLTIYRKLVGASESTTVALSTQNSVFGNLNVYELTGVDTVSPLDRTSSVESASTSSQVIAIPPTSTTTQNNEIAIAAAGFGTSLNTYSSWTNGFKPIVSPSNVGFTGWLKLSGKQAVSTTFTGGSTARPNEGLLVTYKAAHTNQVTAATPAVLQSNATTLNGTTAFTANFAETPEEGSRLFAMLHTSTNPGVITIPDGWSQVAAPQSTNGVTAALYTRLAEANESSTVSFTLENPPTTGNLELYSVRGIVPDSALDKLTTIRNISTDPIVMSSGTTSQASEFALGVTTSNSNTGNPTAAHWLASGYTANLATQHASGYSYLTSIQNTTLSLVNSSTRQFEGILATYRSSPDYVTLSRDTGNHHSGSASAKVLASPWATARVTQSINVGDTRAYTMTAYVRGAQGGAVTSSDAQLYYDNDVISTTYTDVGSGWYKLSATVTGVNSAKTYGVQVPANKTVYVDDFTLSRYQTSGSLTSSIFDLGYGGAWGNLTYTTSGSGTVAVKVRSSNNADMSGAPAFSTCSAISSGASLAGTSCMTDNHRYIQYEVTLTSATGESTPTLESISIAYTHYDTVAPTVNADNIVMKKGPSGATVASNAWTNTAAPYFSWDAASDNAGGEGVAGYCLYLGTTESADPVSTKGLLGTSPLNSGGACQFAVSGTSIDLATSGYLQTALTTSNSPYYLNVKAFDNAGNVVGDSESFHFRFDNTAPTNPAFVSAPSQFISNKQVTITWPDSGGSAASDGNSGIAGLQYRIGASGTWYGDDHSGTQDNTDLLDNDGNYETVPTPDYDNIVDGNNTVYFRTWDEAGNVSVAYVTAVIRVNINGSPTAPQNVQATPGTNTQNSFAFSWIAPATYVGSVSNITYCYTVNTVPTEQTCTFTAAGVTNLPAGAFATQPGQNTFYVVAKDESGSINYATAASTTFTANTSAPGIPLNLDVADISVKASSNWRLAINWEAPTDLGAGVSSYQVYRSTDNITFAKVGSTGGTSYTDTGLQQVTYYYKIRACDSANNCGAFTSVASKLPNGKFTTPPNLTAAVNQPAVEDISTTHATIVWATDRDCDSKVAFGTVSGTYQATEAYSATPTTQHRVQINNLSPGKTYYFKAKWTDEDGNTGASQEVAFQTAPPPVVQDVTTSGVTKDSATVQFTTIAASAIKLYYGPSNSFGGAVELNTSRSESKYIVPLRDLKDGTKYFFKINSMDNDNHEYEGTTLSFTTPPAPRISNLRFQPVETEPSSTQKVSWTTNVPTDSRLNYGVIGGTQLNASDGKMVTEHEMTIRNLEDDKQYSLTALSRDAAGDVATSDRQVFQTALDTRPPKISDVTVEPTVRGSGAEARGQIIVSWTTDEPATSQVAYNSGLATDVYNSRTGEDTAMTTNHVVVVSDLPTSAIYQLQALSADKADNVGKSEGQSTIIGHASDNVLSIVFTALQNIFGFLR